MYANFQKLLLHSHCTILHINGLLGSPNDLVLIGKEDEEYESQVEEYATVEVSWEAVMLGGYTSDVTYHLSYFTVEDNDLIFQLSKELPTNTTSTSVAVRDWYAGLEHLFTVKSVLNTETIVYEGPSLNASIVFGEYNNIIIISFILGYRVFFKNYCNYSCRQSLLSTAVWNSRTLHLLDSKHTL